MKRFIGILCTLYFVTSSLYAQTSFEQANAAYAEYCDARRPEPIEPVAAYEHLRS